VHTVFATLVDPTGTSGQNIYSREIAIALSKHESVDLTLVCPEPENLLPVQLAADDVTTRYLPAKQSRSVRWQVEVQKPMYDALAAAHAEEEIGAIVTPLRPSLVVPPIFSRRWSIPQTLLVEGLMTRTLREIAPFRGAVPLANIVATLNAANSRCVFTAYDEASEWIGSLPLVSEDKISVFPHGINPDEMSPVPENLAREKVGLDVSPDTIVIGFVGSFKWYHRLDLLVEATALLRAEGVSVHLLLTGEGPQLSEIQERCTELGIDDAVTFTGFVEHERVHEYISACTALYGVIDPDHWGSPMKIYEYLACGRRVIAYDSEEFEFVTEHEFGELVDQMSPTDVATAIRRLGNVKTEGDDSTSAKSREYILANRTWSALAEDIVNCIEDSSAR
jgi:glycosyltransferase involved in cell wall biosynthesis